MLSTFNIASIKGIQTPGEIDLHNDWYDKLSSYVIVSYLKNCGDSILIVLIFWPLWQPINSVL